MFWKNLVYLVKNKLCNGACGQSWKWRLRESESAKVTQQEMDRNGIPMACLCDSRVWLWLLYLPLIKGFISLLSLEEPEAASPADLSLESHSLKNFMIFTIIKGKFILSLENFPDQSGST